MPGRRFYSSIFQRLKLKLFGRKYFTEPRVAALVDPTVPGYIKHAIYTGKWPGQNQTQPTRCDADRTHPPRPRGGFKIPARVRLETSAPPRAPREPVSWTQSRRQTPQNQEAYLIRSPSEYDRTRYGNYPYGNAQIAQSDFAQDEIDEYELDEIDEYDELERIEYAHDDSQYGYSRHDDGQPAYEHYDGGQIDLSTLPEVRLGPHINFLEREDAPLENEPHSLEDEERNVNDETPGTWVEVAYAGVAWIKIA